MLNDYYMIPTKVMKGTFEIDVEVRRLTSNEKILYIELVRYGMENAAYCMKGEDKRLHCTVGQGTIGKELEFTRVTVRRNLKSLVQAKLIEIPPVKDCKIQTIYINTDID
ncbi:MAG: hypothetical protein EOM15_14620 [Spirochaetia bacterium]|nr:hypothetical protein [Spirochaetia bacterium]